MQHIRKDKEHIMGEPTSEREKYVINRSKASFASFSKHVRARAEHGIQQMRLAQGMSDYAIARLPARELLKQRNVGVEAAAAIIAYVRDGALIAADPPKEAGPIVYGDDVEVSFLASPKGEWSGTLMRVCEPLRNTNPYWGFIEVATGDRIYTNEPCTVRKRTTADPVITTAEGTE